MAWIEYRKKRQREYYLKHQESRRIEDKEYRENNKEEVKKRGEDWRQRNRDYPAKYGKARKKSDPVFKAACIMRQHLKRYIESAKIQKETSTAEMLGYSFEEFKKNIEDKMLAGMTWENFGEWEIDHLTPVAEQIENDITEAHIVNCLDNLAPMWRGNNRSKSRKTLEEWLSEKGKDSEEYRLYGHYLNKE